MKRTRTAAALTMIGLGAAALFSAGMPAQAATTGLHISGRNVVEADGSTFVMRGVSHGYQWFQTENGAFADIKSLGANTIRVVLTSATTTAQVSTAISLCKASKLICMLEVHDTTGYPGNAGSQSLDWAANFWIGFKSVLVGEENYVAIDIGNEPWGNGNESGWVTAMTNAITKLRANGFSHLLVADGPDWGQDSSLTMENNAAAIENADPDHNTLFSVHMYNVYPTATSVDNYLNAFANAGLPLIVGEFGSDSLYGPVDYNDIINTAQTLGDGWLAWSWSGNDAAESFLDLAIDFNKNDLSTWGQRVFNGANGIAATSVQATIYN